MVAPAAGDVAQFFRRTGSLLTGMMTLSDRNIQWLKFMYSAHMEENVFDAIKMWESEEHRRYIESNRSVLNYELSKNIFDQKVEFERQYQKRFTLECNGHFFFEQFNESNFLG